MKKTNLIRIVFVVIIIFIATFFSMKINDRKTSDLSILGRFFEPAQKIVNPTYLDTEEILLKQLDSHRLIPQERINMEMSKHKNSDNFQDYEHSVEKPNDTFRIIALGDSFTAGAWVAINDSWSKQLETKLNKLNLSYKFEVLNFGIPKAGTKEEVETFEKKGLKYKPDMVILLIFGNDEEDRLWIENKSKELMNDYKNGTFKLPENVEQKAKEIGFTEKEISRLISLIATIDYVNMFELKDRLGLWKENVEKPLLHLIELCKSKNIKLIVVGLNIDSEINYDLIKFFNSHNIAYKELSSVLPMENSNIRFPDDHLNELGYDIMSNEIKQLILNNQEFKR